jgi:hypothetical protein
MFTTITGVVIPASPLPEGASVSIQIHGNQSESSIPIVAR